MPEMPNGAEGEGPRGSREVEEDPKDALKLVVFLCIGLF